MDTLTKIYLKKKTNENSLDPKNETNFSVVEEYCWMCF